MQAWQSLEQVQSLSGHTAFLVFLARATRAGIVAADLRAGTAQRRYRCVVMMPVVVAMRAILIMHVAVMAMIVGVGRGGGSNLGGLDGHVRLCGSSVFGAQQMSAPARHVNSTPSIPVRLHGRLDDAAV
jgi:hypothetical protein